MASSFLWQPLFKSYRKETHSLLRFRFEGCDGWRSSWFLSSTVPSRVAQGFFLLAYSLSLLHEHVSVLVSSYSYSLHLNSNPEKLLTFPSFDHSEISGRRFRLSCLPEHSPPPLPSSVYSARQSTRLRPQFFQLHRVLTFLQKTPPLVSSSFCYQTLHELVEQSSVFRDGVLITFLLYKQMLGVFLRRWTITQSWPTAWISWALTSGSELLSLM